MSQNGCELSRTIRPPAAMDVRVKERVMEERIASALLLLQVAYKLATPFQVGTWQNARNAAPSRPR